jgi:hypothetical protein
MLMSHLAAELCHDMTPLTSIIASQDVPACTW